MKSFLYYGTPRDNYATYYQFQLFYKNEKKFPLSSLKNIVLIRIVATTFLTASLAIKTRATNFHWPIVAMGAAFAGWTAYAHLLSKDPLTEVFYGIVGGKSKFDQLPEIALQQDPNEKLYDAIQKLEWENLTNLIYKTTTLDGRNVVVVKGQDRVKKGVFGGQVKNILTFVEKLGPKDLRSGSNMPELITAAAHAIFLPLKGNTFGGSISSQDSGSGGFEGQSPECYDKEMLSSITTSRANEFFAQLLDD